MYRALKALFRPIALGACSYTFVCPTIALPYNTGGQPPTSERRDPLENSYQLWFFGESHGSSAQAYCSS